MAELTPRERLQPSLLDRLTDDEPDSRQESRDKRVLSVRRLRESVLRDLAWLLNTGSLGQKVSLEEYPEVAQSVVNYGTQDLSGTALSGLDLKEVERRVRQAIWDFEPRVLRKSVKVRAVPAHEKMCRNALGFQIEGELWAQPLPLHLFLKTEVDLETGTTTVTDQTDSPPG